MRPPFVLALIVWIALVCGSFSHAHAECMGPAACCEPTEAPATPTRVRLGLRLMRLRALSEQAGTFDADVTILMRWPAGGRRPALRPRNATANVSVVFDETRLAGGTCYREQRLQGSFQTWYRLRRFPFDAQQLRLNLEEREHGADAMVFERELWPNTISTDAFRELSGWRFGAYPALTVRPSNFAFPFTSQHPQLVVVELSVARLWQFFVTRYLFPLLLIVALAYALFWVRPEDLGSSASIGITCLLAIITFQITQSSALPQVSYLTIADLVYIVCYVATALVLAITVREAYLTGHDRKPEADALDLRWRVLFPLLFFTALGVVVYFGWRSHGDPNRDIPHLLPPAQAPAGEPRLV